MLDQCVSLLTRLSCFPFRQTLGSFFLLLLFLLLFFLLFLDLLFPILFISIHARRYLLVSRIDASNSFQVSFETIGAKHPKRRRRIIVKHLSLT